MTRSLAGFSPAVRLGREGADVAGAVVFGAGLVAGAGSGDFAGAVVVTFGGGADSLGGVDGAVGFADAPVGAGPDGIGVDVCDEAGNVP